MAQRLIDENGVIDFIDQNGMQCFLDEDGNFTCGQTGTGNRRMNFVVINMCLALLIILV